MRVSEAKTPQGQKVAVVPLDGRLDSKASSEVRQMLQQILSLGYINILLNMSTVMFMDSAGLGVIMSAMNKCRAAGGKLCLCEVPEPVQLVLKLSSSDRLLQIFPDTTTAIQNFPEVTSI